MQWLILSVLFVAIIALASLVITFLLWFSGYLRVLATHRIKNIGNDKIYLPALLIASMLIVGACTGDPTPLPATDTLTPEPTADPTPTREHLSYQDCFTGEIVTGFSRANTNNDINPCLDGEFVVEDFGTVDGRYAALYPTFFYWQFPGVQNTYAYMNAGSYFFRGAPRNGMDLELTQVDGQFGIQFAQVFERGICYIIKQTGVHSIPNGSIDNIWLSAQIHITDETIVQLRNQSFGGRFSGTQGHEIFWVVQTDQTYVDSVVAIYTEVVWANYLDTHVTIHAIEVLDAPPEFCEGDGVIEF